VVSSSLDQTVRVWDIGGLRKKTVAPGGEDLLRLPQVRLSFSEAVVVCPQLLWGWRDELPTPDLNDECLTISPSHTKKTFKDEVETQGAACRRRDCR